MAIGMQETEICNYSHFMNDEVQTEKSYVTCVRSHNQVTELNNEE